ncbi:MAG: hypothetical protein AAF196_05210 [Planctomycetota bacterium]
MTLSRNGATASLALLLALAAPSLPAQSISCGDAVLATNLGTAQGATDEALIAGLSLGFPFTFPDGTVTSTIDVTSNGRITLPGSLTSSDFTPDRGTFLSEPSALAPLWVDLDYVTGDVFFNATPTEAVITWQDAVVFGGTNPLTFQAILRSDSSFSFIYDSRIGAEIEGAFLDSVIGATPGNAATDPGDTDFDLFVNGPGDSGTEPSVYEFFLAGGDGFDLTGFALDFEPNGNGGYTVSSDCARGAATSTSCTLQNDAFRFTPDGTGGYDVAEIPPFFESNIGPDLGLTDEDESDQAMPFSFVMPGGALINTIRVTSNGRLLDPASGSLARFFVDPTFGFQDGPAICAGWVDLDATNRGSVHFDGNATRALVTWQDIPEFDEDNSITFQARLFPDGSFDLSFVSFPLLFDAVIGTFGGSGTISSETDLSNAPSSAGSPDLFEFIDMVAGDTSDIAIPLRTFEVSPPQIGGTYDLMVDGIPPTALTAGILVGFANLNVDLGPLLPLDRPSCILATNGTLNVPLTILTGGASSVASINVPNRPALAGIEFHAQGYVIDPTQNPLALGLANGLTGRVGL